MQGKREPRVMMGDFGGSAMSRNSGRGEACASRPAQDGGSLAPTCGGPLIVGILDNDPLAAHSLAAILSRAPRRFRVIWQCQSAPEAIQRCLHAQVRPHVLVCDIALSGMSGMDVCRMLRRSGSRMGIVLVTAYDSSEYAASAANVAAQAVLSKSEAVRGLMEAVWSAGHGKGMPGFPDIPPDGELPVPERVDGAGSAAGDAAVLSAREKHVMRLFAQGLKADDIARQLGVSCNTVMTYTHRVLRKLHVDNRREALDICDRYDLLM